MTVIEPYVRTKFRSVAVQNWRASLVRLWQVMDGHDAWLCHDFGWDLPYDHPYRHVFRLWLARGPRGRQIGFIHGETRKTPDKWVWKPGVDPTVQDGRWTRPRKKTARWGHYEPLPDHDVIIFDNSILGGTPHSWTRSGRPDFCWIPCYAPTPETVHVHVQPALDP